MRYLFEDYVLDVERHELRKGDAVLSVEPQVFDLLACLIRNREKVVSRDDLLADVWQGRSISDSTFTSRINAARAAIGDRGEEQRLIRTVPRRGYRFVGSVREEETSAEAVAGAASAGAVAADGATDQPAPASGANRSLRGARSRTIFILSAGGAAAAIAAALLSLLWPSVGALRGKGAPAKRFDASAVPLVNDEDRRILAGYPGRLDVKALAIAREGWSIADGASDIEAAKREALRQCGASAKGVCRIYAVGMDVVWSRDTLPLPAAGDLHSEPLEARLVADDIPTLNGQARREIAQGHMNGRNHKAFALTTRGYYWANNSPTRTESIRVAVERCADLMKRPCLLLAVDGFLTVQIPKSRPITGIFLPSTEAGISSEDRQRLGRIYQGREWRALARGGKGSWHAVAAAPSEAAAIEGALSSCSQSDDACRLYAVGNFRVADE